MQVVLAVQHSDLGLALQLSLDTVPGLFVVGMATETASLRALLRTADPDLVILDWDLPGHCTASQLLVEARQAKRCPTTIMLGRDEGVRQEALEAGADAFVLLGNSPVELMAAIQESRGGHRGG